MIKLFLILLLSSSSSFARQYIQCASFNSWDRAVINLDEERSTFFMTSGVHVPDEVRVLKDLFFQGIEVVDKVKKMTTHNFITRSDGVSELIKVPSRFIGFSAKYLEVEVTHFNKKFKRVTKMGCFSSIYQN